MHVCSVSTRIFKELAKRGCPFPLMPVSCQSQLYTFFLPQVHTINNASEQIDSAQD